MSRDSGVADYFDHADIRQAHADAGHLIGNPDAHATGAQQMTGFWNSPQMLAAIQKQDEGYNNWLASNPDLSKAGADPLGSFGEFLGANQQQKIDHDTGIGNIIGSLVIAAATAGIGTAVGGGIMGGAVQGATAGSLNAGLQGKPIGKGALVGAIGGGFGSASSGVTSGLVQDGVNPLLASGLVKAGVGAVTGGIGAGLSGQSVGSGIAGGAMHGAISAGTNAVAGSVMSGAGTIFQGQPQNNPILSSEETYTAPAPQFDAYNSGDNPNMSYDFNEDPDGLFQPIDTSYASYMGDPMNGGDPLAGVSNPGYENLPVAGGGSTLGGGYGNGSPAGGSTGGSILSKLASLLGGGGGAGGANAGLLAQLLGLGTQAGSLALNSSAARGAASTFANQTKYNPYGVTTNNGTTGFDGTNAFSKLSPGAQTTATGLNGMNNAQIAALTAGPGADRTANFNALTSSQLQAQQRLMANTQDNEFANGILGSTAGGYQTQGALGAIGQQISGDQVTANDMANTTQQQRLNDLTAGLNGSQQISQQQLQQILAGGNIGSSASYANNAAYRPQLTTNANSTAGTLLGQLAPMPVGGY